MNPPRRRSYVRALERHGAQRTLAQGDQLWRIERDGAVLRTAEGPTDHPARTTLRACSSVAAAARHYARAVQIRHDRGWRPADAPPSWPADCHPPEAIHDVLERRLQRDPWSIDLADLYLTWLSDQHDPRGQLGRLQHRSAQPTEDVARPFIKNFAWLLDHPARPDTLPPSWRRSHPRPHASPQAEADALLARHARHLLGPLRAHADRLALTWHRGFLDTATLLEDAGDDDELSNADLLHLLLHLRSARLLRGLAIELAEDDSGDDGDPDAPIDLLAGMLAAPTLRALRSFTLGREPFYDDEEDDDFYDLDTARDSAPILGALDRLGDLFPRLEHLALAGRDLGLGDDLHLPLLRHAELHLARPEQPALAAFARADWPNLVSLRLGLGNFRRAAHATDALAVLGPILTAARMPRLRHLALVHPPDADAVCAALVRVPAVARLETLEISSADLTAFGARELAQARPRLAALRRLHLADNLLTAADERRLRRAFTGVDVYTGPQRSPQPRDLDDDEWAESLRLAALGGAPPAPSGLMRSEDDLPDHLDDRFELLLDRVVVDPPTTEEDPRLPRPDDET